MVVLDSRAIQRTSSMSIGRLDYLSWVDFSFDSEHTFYSIDYFRLYLNTSHSIVARKDRAWHVCVILAAASRVELELRLQVV